MKKNISILVSRWKSDMPKLFKIAFRVSSFIGGFTLAATGGIHAAGYVEPEWFATCVPYIIGISAGIAFTAKFTQTSQSSNNPPS